MSSAGSSRRKEMHTPRETGVLLRASGATARARVMWSDRLHSVKVPPSGDCYSVGTVVFRFGRINGRVWSETDFMYGPCFGINSSATQAVCCNQRSN